jgi:hypothetical protein
MAGLEESTPRYDRPLLAVSAPQVSGIGIHSSGSPHAGSKTANTLFELNT